MKRKNSGVAAAMLIAAGCLPIVTSGCGDDSGGADLGGTGQSTSGTSNGGTGAGQGNGGKGGNSSAGKSAGGTKAYAGATGEGGEGGEDMAPNAGRSGGGAAGTSAGGAAGGGGKGGAGGTAGGGGAGGTAGGGGVSGNAGGGAGGMSGGGSGGTSGSGGSAGGSTCANGVVNDGELCDPVGGAYKEDDCGGVWGPSGAENGASSACQAITTAACATCEDASECGALASSTTFGNQVAMGGPAAGILRSVLYNRTMDCARDTNCAVGLPIDCYCGTATSAQCDAGNGNGKCRKIIEEGLETTTAADVQARFSTPTYGAGLAMARINCDQQNCLDACFPLSP